MEREEPVSEAGLERVRERGEFNEKPRFDLAVTIMNPSSSSILIIN